MTERISLDRRQLVGGLMAAALAVSVPPRIAVAATAIVTGALGAPDANGLALPPGFKSRIVARSGDRPTSRSRYAWHSAPDGGASFALPDGGWIYVSNSELDTRRGGASALRFAADGVIADCYPILAGTTRNCSGGATPWGTWLSCEEYERGQVWECDPEGRRPAMLRPALGTFVHEAVAVDDRTGCLYLTEDAAEGLWYRFVPAPGTRGAGSLEAGTLEAARVDAEGRVRWLPVPDPLARRQTTRRQLPAATRFRGGEGIWCARGQVWFTTKGDNRVWHYDIGRALLAVLYEAGRAVDPLLSGVDNCTLASNGDLLVAEDGGDMQIVAVRPDGSVLPVVQVHGHRASELAGVAFDPSGRRLYFSSQRGASGRREDGVTYEVSGPFASG